MEFPCAKITKPSIKLSFKYECNYGDMILAQFLGFVSN